MPGFDGWNARYCGDAISLPGDALAHFRTKGSKNGIRRYQQEDGTWTPLGLRERKAREGWGLARAERKLARAKARTQRIKAKEATRTKIAKEKEKLKAEKAKIRLSKSGKPSSFKPLSRLSDEELRKKIERAKLESQYKELTKNPALKSAEKAVGSFLKYLDKHGDRKWEREKMGLERSKLNVDRARIAADVVRSKQQTKTAEQNAKQAASQAKIKQFDVKGGLKIQRKADLKRAKKENRESTLLGAFIKTHKEAKLARIENRKDTKKGLAFVKSVLGSQKKVDKWNRKSGNTRVNFNAERYQGEHKDKHNLSMQKELTKQQQAKANQEEAKKDTAYWNYKTSGRKKNK